MKRKGVAQIIWLIIAASALMTVSIALTYATQGTLGDTAPDNDTHTSEDPENQSFIEKNPEAIEVFEHNNRTCYGYFLNDRVKANDAIQCFDKKGEIK